MTRTDAVQTRIAELVIVGTDALLAARPGTPVQLAHACRAAGFDAAVPASWGDELVAGETVRQMDLRGGLPAVLCACPRVEARLLGAGGELAPFLIGVVAPPIAAARYIRRLYAEHPVRITYVGACPAASADASIDRAVSPREFIDWLVDQGIEIALQPTVFDSVIPPDRRRHLSLPGGLPAPPALWHAGQAPCPVVELDGDDFATELAHRLFAGERALIDVAPRLGCACAGATGATAHGNARALVAATEPPRASRPVVEAMEGLELQRALPVRPHVLVPASAAETAAVQAGGNSATPMPPRPNTPPNGARRLTSAGPGSEPPTDPLRKRSDQRSGIFRAYTTGTVPHARSGEGRAYPRAYGVLRRTPSGGATPVNGARVIADPAVAAAAGADPAAVATSGAPVDAAVGGALTAMPGDGAAEASQGADRSADGLAPVAPLPDESLVQSPLAQSPLVQPLLLDEHALPDEDTAGPVGTTTTSAADAAPDVLGAIHDAEAPGPDSAADPVASIADVAPLDTPPSRGTPAEPRTPADADAATHAPRRVSEPIAIPAAPVAERSAASVAMVRATRSSMTSMPPVVHAKYDPRHAPTVRRRRAIRLAGAVGLLVAAAAAAAITMSRGGPALPDRADASAVTRESTDAVLPAAAAATAVGPAGDDDGTFDPFLDTPDSAPPALLGGAPEVTGTASGQRSATGGARALLPGGRARPTADARALSRSGGAGGALPGRTVFTPRRGDAAVVPAPATPPASPASSTSAVPTPAELTVLRAEIAARRARMDSIARRLDSLQRLARPPR